MEAKEEKELSKHKAAINSGEEEYGATEEEKESEGDEEDESLGELLTLDEFIEKQKAEADEDSYGGDYGTEDDDDEDSDEDLHLSELDLDYDSEEDEDS